MAELKPCPFCGGKAAMKLNDTTLNCVAVCAKCNVIMKRNFKGHKKLQVILAVFCVLYAILKLIIKRD